MNRFCIVRYQAPGFHNWPDASGERAYLADRHRHLFFVEAKIELNHNEREIEFHDFLDSCKSIFSGGELGSSSCETIAENLVEAIQAQWPDRRIGVSVFEDNEVGAYVSNY